jgi:hypothetical protein
MKRHSPALLLGRSDVESAPQAVIQSARMNVASSITVIEYRRWSGGYGSLSLNSQVGGRKRPV